MDSSTTPPKDWRDVTRFDAEYTVPPSKTLVQIFRDAYGDDYPDEVEPYSFLTKTDLACIVPYLDIGTRSILVDLGCGRGGPGLWLARETGADLIGIDLSPNAIQQANQRVSKFGLGGRARFLRGDLCATGLPDQSCDGAISIDVVMFIPDQDVVMREAARILRPGAPFVFTAFEGRHTERYRVPLHNNGFTVDVYDEKPDWRRRQRILYERVLAEQAALVEGMGEGARIFVAEAEDVLANRLSDDARHVFVVSRRT